MPDAETKNTPPGATRLLPVDALRGLIIVFMALDHANCFVAQKHSSGEMWGGPFPTYTETSNVDLEVLLDDHHTVAERKESFELTPDTRQRPTSDGAYRCLHRQAPGLTG